MERKQLSDVVTKTLVPPTSTADDAAAILRKQVDA